MFRVARSFTVAAILAAGVAITQAPASAQLPPSPCDSITGGGFVITDLAEKANFGAHGGCKKSGFSGHVNYVDHGGFLEETPYHVRSTEITGYLEIGPNIRDICGIATTNADEPQPVRFRVRMVENGDNGTFDMFGIRLSNGYLVTVRFLGDGTAGGGNIQLHKPKAPNPDPDANACDGVAPPDGGGANNAP